jgi:prepilin-type processing-associated H-X9-DG protein
MADEARYSINDAGLATCANLSAPAFIDFPSSAHNGGCAFSFCDGHAELHKWKGRAIYDNTVQQDNASHAIKPNSPDMVDFIWLATHSSTKIK